jgi:hypothetical protein
LIDNGCDLEKPANPRRRVSADGVTPAAVGEKQSGSNPQRV